MFDAQTAAIVAARNGTITADVDRDARVTISAGGYGQYFTHRLGHGKLFYLFTCIEGR